MKPEPIAITAHSPDFHAGKDLLEDLLTAALLPFAQDPKPVTRAEVIAECERVMTEISASGPVPQYEIRVTDDAVEVWDLAPSSIRLDVTINADGTVTNNLKGD